MYKLKLNLKFDWKPVLLEDGTEYLFPGSQTRGMKERYGGPAVYRWNIYTKVSEDLKLAYIGETVSLCPGRIAGYLKPGPSQITNRRINGEFKELIAKGRKIRLETLVVTDCVVDKFTFSAKDFEDSCFRRTIEHLMVTMAKRSGFELLNASCIRPGSRLNHKT